MQLGNNIIVKAVTTILGGMKMGGKNSHTNRGTKAPGVNPQGYGQDAEYTPNPKSKLENRAKKSNTKI